MIRHLCFGMKGEPCGAVIGLDTPGEGVSHGLCSRHHLKTLIAWGLATPKEIQRLRILEAK